MMQEKQAGESIDSYMEFIDRSLSRIQSMRTLIMDLLDLTHIESGKRQRTLREIDLTLVARSAIETMTPLAIQRDISLTLDGTESVVMLADSDDMEILFNNLISNAVKYNRQGGWVKCSISKTNDSVEVRVSDSGIGIQPDDIPKLFQEFSRIKNPLSKNVTGSGLGLSIVKRIADMYSATIKVDSQAGVGSTFTVKFPTINSASLNDGI